MEYSFTEDTQEKFAQLSGDWNPMHMDSHYARRLLVGSPVVHGIHSALKCLDFLVDRYDKSFSVENLKFDFKNPLAVGKVVQFELVKENLDELEVIVRAGSLIYTRVTGMMNHPDSIIENVCTLPNKGKQVSCNTITSEDISNQAGELPLFLDTSLTEEMFPALVKKVPFDQLAEILASTRLVGMECPGLNSIFTTIQFTVNLERLDSSVLKYEVTSYDSRFSWIKMHMFGACLEGKIDCFLRPPPVQQPSLESVSEHVKSTEFAKVRALIVGGSRGLGELTAKVIVAGGGSVAISYHRGKEDAIQVQNELNVDANRASIIQLDVSKALDDKFISFITKWSPNCLYYYATPFIFEKDGDFFSSAMFQKFSKFYIDGFYYLVGRLLKYSGRELRVLYPSSTALDTYEKNMIEYSAAKAAGEYICGLLEHQNENIFIHCPRLPRLSTDQTATVSLVETNETLQIMLKEMRALREKNSLEE